ncbi:MAG: hypothetical protein HKM00_09585 [Gallionella sp.]|nr:hypothetical protein [Gallionella sp.]
MIQKSAILLIALTALLASCADITNQFDPLESRLNTTLVDGPNGMRVSCAEIDDFGKGKFDSSEVVFDVKKSEWTWDIFRFLDQKIGQCYSQFERELSTPGFLKIGYSTPQEREQIAIAQQHAQSKVNQIESENNIRTLAEKTKQEETQRQEIAHRREAEAQAEIQQQARIEACKNSKPYQLFSVQEEIISNLEDKAHMKSGIAEDQKIIQVAGVSDLNRRYDYGLMIVRLDEQLKKNWITYKSLGGEATSLKKVKHQFLDPCAQLN